MVAGLSKDQLEALFNELNRELQKDAVQGDIYLVGGAVMCLVYGVRPTTQDVDAFFSPATKIRDAAARLALDKSIDEGWLNDAVKSYLSDKGTFAPYLELTHLKVMVAQPQYLLAMKCLSMRLEKSFHDYDDIQYLLKHLHISDHKQAIALLSQYYPLERFPQKTRYALEEMCQTNSDNEPRLTASSGLQHHNRYKNRL